jgi:hypothetical protein
MAGQFIDPNQLKDNVLVGKYLDNTNTLDRIKARRGLLGGIWGVSSNVPNNIAGFIAIVLTIAGIAFTAFKINSPIDEKSLSVKDFWSLITPLITLAIGYLFGDKKKGEDE